MDRLLAPLLVVSLLAGPALAQSQVYRWVDEAGEVHYTDDPDSIPAGKKKSAKKTEGKALDYISTGQGEARRSPPGAAERRAEGEAREQAAREEEARQEREWRERFREAYARIERLEQRLEADKKALVDPLESGIARLPPDHNGVILPNPEFEAIKKRIPELEKELAQAREDLADLDREASRKAVPRHWRR